MTHDLKGLSPAYFGMVMATGIISLTAHFLGFDLVAIGLFYLNLCFFCVLWIATLARLLIYRREFLLDLIDHLRGPGFFTLPAGASVLGSQFITLTDYTLAGRVLWVFAIILWLTLIYTIFTAFTVKEEKPTLDKGITGGWLLAVVATQSIAVLSALIAVDIPQPYKLGVNFLALTFWRYLCGCGAACCTSG